MFLGNTFGATSFTSYGAYWISWGLLSTLEKNQVVPAYDASAVCQKETVTGIFLLVSLMDSISISLDLFNTPTWSMLPSLSILNVYMDTLPTLPYHSYLL